MEHSPQSGRIARRGTKSVHVALPKHILKRGQVYAVRFNVPRELQEVVGRKEVIRSLATTDLRQALAKRDETLRQIRAEVSDRLEGLARPARTNGSKGASVRDTAHRWLVASDGIRSSTEARYRQHLEAFEEYSGNIEVAKINRSLALGFIEHLKGSTSKRTGQPLSARYLASYQVCLASFWRVLDHWGLVDPDVRNPFSSLLRRVAGQKQIADPREKKLRPVTRDEAEALIKHILGCPRLKYRMEMYVTVRLLWVTACRLNEVCARRLEEIDDRGDHIRITIPEAKTEAGRRIVVVVGEDDCRVLREAVRRAREDVPTSAATLGLLFPRVQLGGYDKQPSHFLGKALQKVRKKIPGHET